MKIDSGLDSQSILRLVWQTFKKKSFRQIIYKTFVLKKEKQLDPALYQICSKGPGKLLLAKKQSVCVCVCVAGGEFISCWIVSPRGVKRAIEGALYTPLSSS